MNEINTHEISTQSRTLFEKLREEALDLEMVDKFLSSVEQKNRLVSGMLFDNGRLHEALFKLAAGHSSGDDSEIEEAELIAESELASWRETLELRNDMIETYHIRRFHDYTKAPLDISLLISLARVFRSLPYSESNQSKYDLVVTRLFTKGDVESKRMLRVPRAKIGEALKAIFPDQPSKHPDRPVEGVIEYFDEFIASLKNLGDFEEFIETDSFEALRRYKRDLGELFFHPDVSAAAIECNVTIGNVFSGLINHDNGPLYELINNKFDFAGVFHDVSPSAKTKLWDEFDLDQPDDESSFGSPDREKIKELLEIIGSDHFTASGEKGCDPESESDRLEKSASDLVNEFLLKLSVANPDFKVIRSELDHFGVLQSVDLEYILGGKLEAVTELCKSVLALIIWTEELCAYNLEDMDHLSENAKSQAATLIQLSERYQQELQEAVNRNGYHEQIRLLTVSNRLLASHLDLKKMLVQHTQMRLEVFEDPPQARP
ncbi:MAG: hypothetical protein OEM82_06990 [Acidobacteriota bacterium]|nr:hypothetical protein [Acidobacteriota bacterium]MDH3528077.1 hypothetical protein [Acidobacteriota bacterium]